MVVGVVVVVGGADNRANSLFLIRIIHIHYNLSLLGQKNKLAPSEWMQYLIPRLRFINQINDKDLTVTNCHGDCN